MCTRGVPSIPMSKWVAPIQVTHIENPGQVWISQDEDREKVMAEVDSLAGTLTKLDVRSVKEGDMVAAIFSEDGATYRAIVKKILKNAVDVLFCDFGNGETVDMDDLMELPKVLSSRHPVAVLVNVEGNEGVEDNERNRSKVEKKLMVDDLMVKLTQDADKISAKFAVNGKKIKFGKSKDKEVSEDQSPRTDSGSAVTKEVPAAREEVLTVDIPKSSSKVVMCSQLPALEILKNVKYEGLVNYVSALGTVWFRPSWTFPSIDDLSAKFEDLGAKNKLQPVEIGDLCIGLLCVARNGVDGLFYRARVIQELENSVCTVKYIDYGDSERLPLFNIFYYPTGVDMVAPGAEEIILARQPKANDVQALLTDTLMDVEGVQLYLEIDETGSKVGRFYVNGEEMKWDEMISTQEVFNKDERAADGEEDVVVEAAPVDKVEPSQEPVSKSEVLKESVAVEDNKVVDTKKSDAKPETKAIPKLTRLVPPNPLVDGKIHQVTLQHVESTSKVWVCREDDLSRVDNIMERLAFLGDLHHPSKVPKGAVFGARFSEDDELYRVGTVAKQEDQQYLVQFIDFGNMETKPQAELFLLPEDLAGEPAAAVGVHLDTGLEDTEENRSFIDSLLAQDSLTVVIENGKGKFSTHGNYVKFSCQKEETIIVRKSSIPEPTPEPEPAKQEAIVSKEESIKKSSQSNVDKADKAKTSKTVPTPLEVVNEVSVSVKQHFEKPEDQQVAQQRQKVIDSQPSKLAVNKDENKIKDYTCPTVEKPKVHVNDNPCFVKAINDIQTKPRKRPALNQEKARRNIAVAGSRDANEAQELPWRQGEAVVVRCSDGVWRDAKIVASKMSRVFVSIGDNETVWVEVKNVRSGVPAEALNKIDKDINANNLVRETGDVADLDTGDLLTQAVDKVNNWMQYKCNNQDMAPRLYGDASKVSQLSKKLPEGSKLVEYCRTRPGSEHVQSVLNTSNVQLARNVLTTLLCHCNPISLITGPSSSFVIQKLISVLPSSELEAIHEVILTNFLELSIDKSGCRIVQIMLEFSNESQQRQLTSLLCNPNIVMTLACDSSGTYVAQACLPHLPQAPDQLHDLVLTVLPNIVELGTHPQGTFFLQRLINVLNNFPQSAGPHLIFEEILKGLSQMILSEPGSRFIQAVLKECPKGVFIRVCNWVVDNMESVLIIKPAVFLAREMIIQIELAMANDDSWRLILERFVKALLEVDQDSVDRAPLLVTASLHACGHILTREIVSRINLVSGSLRNEIMFVLGASVDTLKFSKTGSYVLKGLESILI